MDRPFLSSFRGVREVLWVDIPFQGLFDKEKTDVISFTNEHIILTESEASGKSNINIIEIGPIKV
jgi:hypothetical protein